MHAHAVMHGQPWLTYGVACLARRKFRPDVLIPVPMVVTAPARPALTARYVLRKIVKSSYSCMFRNFSSAPGSLLFSSDDVHDRVSLIRLVARLLDFSCSSLHTAYYRHSAGMRIFFPTNLQLSPAWGCTCWSPCSRPATPSSPLSSTAPCLPSPGSTSASVSSNPNIGTPFPVRPFGPEGCPRRQSSAKSLASGFAHSGAQAPHDDSTQCARGNTESALSTFTFPHSVLALAVSQTGPPGPH